MRTPREVLDDHLAKADAGAVEADLAENFAPDVVVLSCHGVHRGHAGMRHLARLLRRELPNARYRYVRTLVDGEIGFLEWQAWSKRGTVCDGVDSYVIRDGRIVAQTIHYTVEPRSGDRPERQGGASAPPVPAPGQEPAMTDPTPAPPISPPDA